MKVSFLGKLKSKGKLLKDIVVFSLKRRIKVNGSNVEYKLPGGFSLSQLDYDRYLRTKSKEEDTFYWVSLHSNRVDDWNVFLDIGCNVGVFSLLARKLYADIDVVAFDPLLENCITTYKMLKENSNIDSVSIVQQAFLSDGTTIQNSINLLAPPGSTIGTAKERSINPSLQHGSCLSTPLSSFGLFCRQKPDQKKTICKIDVDGPELEILKGFSQEQLSAIGSICVEVDVFEPEIALEIDRFLQAQGLIPSISNIKSLDSYISNSMDEYKTSLNNLKRQLTKNNESGIDDGLIGYLDEINYHELRAITFFSKHKEMSLDARQTHRIALNWFYYDAGSVVNL